MSVSKYIAILLVLFLYSCKKDTSVVNNPYQDEPPRNPFLADSPWPITHGNSYAQASSPFPGPKENSAIVKDFKQGTPGTVTMVISGIYPSGNRVIWFGNNTDVTKVKDTGNGFQIISKKGKENNSLANTFSV